MPLPIKRLPLALKFTPDVPVSGLAIDEFRDGANVEYDVRGIRSVAGDTSVLSNLPSGYTPTFITSGFRNVNNNGVISSVYFIFVAAYTSTNPTGGTSTGTYGKWFMYNTSLPAAWIDVTPVDNNVNAYIAGYNQDTNITASWNGTTLIINDAISAPMFIADNDTAFSLYTQLASKLTIWNMLKNAPATDQSYIAIVGAKNVCSVNLDVLTVSSAIENDFYVGMELTSSNTSFIKCKVTAKNTSVTPTRYTLSVIQPSLTNVTVVNNQWPTWFANDTVKTWARSTDLSITNSLSGFDAYTWSIRTASVLTQYSIGLNVKGSPGYIANDSFVGSNAKLSPKYVWNYNPNWRSVVVNFLRLYNTPNVGSILVAGGLTVVDKNNNKISYPTTINWSQAFGLNDIPLTWEPTITNVANQLEVPVQGQLIDGFSSNGNFYVSSYFDTAILSPLNYTSTAAPILSVRPFNPGRGMYSTNCWVQSDTKVFGIDARDVWEFSEGQFKSLGNQTTKNYLADDISSANINRIFMVHNSNKYQIEIYYTSDFGNIGGVPNKMLAYRYDLGLWNSPRDVSSATQATETPLLIKSVVSNLTYYTPSLSTKSILYARGIQTESVYTNTTQFAMKDLGYSFIPNNGNTNGTIYSYFKKDGIPLADNFNMESTVHRVYPELSQLGTNYESNRNIQIEPVGSVDVYLNGSNSPGTSYTTIGVNTISINSAIDNPYVQYNKAKYRSHGIQVSGQSSIANPNIWYISAASLQYSIEKEEE